MGRIGENSKPAWLEGLMGETFFAGCGVHQTRRKNEKNIFCLACCVSFCPHCLPSHRSHPLLQVRRYVYHDVVRLVDLQKLIDSSFIQPYTINGAKVIFVKQRTQSSRAQSGGSSSSSGNSSRAWRAGGSGGSTTPNMCFTCDRILQPPFHFCSLSCKVDHMVCQGGEGIWMSSSSQLDGLRLNSALLDDHDHDQDDDNDNQEQMAAAPTTHNYNPSSSAGEAEGFLKRKKKAPSTTTDSGSSGGASGSTATRTSRFLSVFSLNSRRKQGAPHRAPLS